MGRRKETGRYETREELCKNVWEDYRASPPNDRNRTRRIAALNGCSMSTVNKILNTFEGLPAKETPLTEGYVDKGGVNREPSLITERPPPPAPMHPADNFAKNFVASKGALAGVDLEPEEEFVVQEMDEDGEGNGIGWFTRMTYATESEAQAYMDGVVHTHYPHKLRVAKVIYETLRVHAPPSSPQ